MAHIFHFHEPPHKADQLTQLAAKQSGQPRARRLRVTIFALIGILLLLILLVEFARVCSLQEPVALGRRGGALLRCKRAGSHGMLPTAPANHGECKAPPTEDATGPIVPATQEYPLQRSTIVMKSRDDAKCDECSESGVSAEKCSADAREGTAKSSEESKDCRDNQKSCPCK